MKNVNILEIWGEITTFGHFGSKHEFCDNDSSNLILPQTKCSLKPYGCGGCCKMKKSEKCQHFGDMGQDFHIWAFRAQNTFFLITYLKSKSGE